MFSDGSCHNLDRDCETATHELCHQQHPSTGLDQTLDRSNDGSVTFEDQKSNILFLAKDQCEEVESRLITLSDTTSLGNQLSDQSTYEATLASVTTASSQYRTKRIKSSLGEGTGENLDGFQSPTKVMDLISSSSLKCPPAPRKPKATPLRKRKGESINLEVEFVNEVDMVLRLLSSKLKRARRLAT